MSVWYRFMGLLPFEWAAPGQYMFMKHALLAILLITPLYSFLSTMVVIKRMSFFSDALGHSAFTGIAIGMMLGWIRPVVTAVVFSVVFAMCITFFSQKTKQSKDTVIGVFSSIAVSLGIFLTTWGGNSFTKLNQYLVGDILSVTPSDLGMLLLLLVLVITVWFFLFNPLLLMSFNPEFAISRRVNAPWTEFLFSALLAVTVTITISWSGLLVINSMLVLPAATSRNISSHISQYHRWAYIFSLVPGIIGLLISYELGSSAGATIVLLQGILFLVSYWLRKR